MPPKQSKNQKPSPKEIIRIDANKHNEALREIELKRQLSLEMKILAEEEEMFEETVEEEELLEYEESISEYEFPIQEGRIDLSFPETTEEFENSELCYPPSYYTVSCKERLLLLFAENFRKQFVFANPKRRPLVLALLNECNVQKFVCTTIRPTAFLHLPLIANDENIASFVADFIIYEPLEEFNKIPTRCISPASLLRRRRGNSFEMATLLCSMLIGAGFPAMVVSGVARNETIQNKQMKAKFPYKIIEREIEEPKPPEEDVGQKYKLRPLPDLNSHLQENMEKVYQEIAEEENRKREENERLIREELELRPVDRHHFKRSHAWVVILNNAPWSVQPRQYTINEEGESVPEPITARFVEPSSGFFFDTNCKQYILIDSVWNHENYYVNKQTYQRVSEIRWDLDNINDWEHLLPGEPMEFRKHKQASDENVVEVNVGEEKHLDVILSWVIKLHIGQKEFEERFPDLQKTVYYYRTKHERFSPYTQQDGKTEQITLYADDKYMYPMVQYEYFQNRSDRLLEIKYTLDTQIKELWFEKGRKECLKYMRLSNNPESHTKYLYFYSEPRLDSLKYLEYQPETLILEYDERSDRCYYQEFEFKAKDLHLKNILEKFKRSLDPDVPAYQDIAERWFAISQKKIYLKFQYARGALTASTREFIKPAKPNYGEELKYDSSLTKAFKTNAADPDPTPLEIYKLLLQQLKAEEHAKRDFESRWEEINDLLEQQQNEMENPELKFSIFDPLRNGAARALRLKEFEEEQRRLFEVANNPPDYLAPYLASYQGRQLTYDESLAAYNACLESLKTSFVELLNTLQRQYEDLTNEAKSLKRFMDKFENQFNNHDYQQLVKEARDIELNKRMLQLRITLTHEESQKKYETVKESLRKDPRLCLSNQLLAEENSKNTKK